jgi:hypothetical protein
MSKTKCLLLINNLPKELVDYIFQYLKPITLVFLNKKYYQLHHPSIKLYLCNIKHQYSNYIRDIIRRDNDFVFSFIIEENWKNWLNFKNYSFKDKIFMNYIYFLIDYCFTYDSNKCKDIIYEKLDNYEKWQDNKGLSKNLHKKNLVKIIKRKWTN